LRPVIHSQKHYVQISRSDATTGTRNTEPLIIAVEGTVANAVDEVIEGAVVKAVFIELWCYGSTNDQHFIVCVTKDPSALAPPNFTNMVGLGVFTNKKNVLFTSQGLVSGDSVGPPSVVLRGWVKIPKTKQRFGLGDKLTLSIASQGDATIHYCGFATYKEYT